MTDTNNTVDAVAMIKEIYDKVVTSKDKAHKLHKKSLRQYFIEQFKAGKYQDYCCVTLSRGNANDVATQIAQITFKYLEPDEKAVIENDFKDSQ